MGDSWLPAGSKNPLVLLGVVILTATVAVTAVASVPVRTAVAQATLPLLVAVGMFVAAWYLDIEWEWETARTVFGWTVGGVLSFMLIGFYFGFLARNFETSFLLAVFASITTGAALGAIIGTYSARLQVTNERLRTKSERLSEYASLVSHDLRNPMNVATARLALVREQRDDENLRKASAALERMEQLITDMLAMARQEDAVIDTEVVDLDAVANEAWAVVETSAAQFTVRDDGRVVADRRRLQQLFENLIRNSIEHGQPENTASADAESDENTGDHTRVTITVGPRDDGFYVADDGPGIPEDERDQIFDAGYTTDEHGTGFGLSIVDRIADAHDWEIEVTESDSGGARFDFTGVERR